MVKLQNFKFIVALTFYSQGPAPFIRRTPLKNWCNYDDLIIVEGFPLNILQNSLIFTFMCEQREWLSLLQSNLMWLNAPPHMLTQRQVALIKLN